MVHQVSKNVHIPVIGIGGIKSVSDVIEFLIAGATAVQIGTYNFIDPLICHNIIQQLPATLKKLNVHSISELTNTLSTGAR